MIIQARCAIRDCDKMARVEADYYHPDRRFSLCRDCYSAVVLDTMIRIEQDGDLPAKTAFAFASVFNGWLRKRKDAMLSHKSGAVTSIKRLDMPTIIGGN